MIPANRSLNDLQPYVKYLAERLIEECKKQGLRVIIIETKRSAARQLECYRNGTGPKLLGPHGYGLAFDAVPLQPNGAIKWSDYAKFKKMGFVGKQLGLAWGGEWKNMDCPHFEYRGGLTDTQIRAGKLPNFPPIPGQKEEEVDFLKYPMKPVAKGRLLNTNTLQCCNKPSNDARTDTILRKAHEPFNIFAKVTNEDIDWYLINVEHEQWVAASYVRLEALK